MSIEKVITLSILMPCLNEARTLGTCISKAQAYLARQNFLGEIIVADNGSIDGSMEIAKSLGARVVAVPERGYGKALQMGIKAAHGKFVIMGDTRTTVTISDPLRPSSKSSRRGTIWSWATGLKAASKAAPCLRCTATLATPC